MVPKLLLVSCLIAVGVGGFIGLASAQATCNNPAPFPANAEPICENHYGGTFASEPGPPPTNTCTVVSTTSEVVSPVAPGCNKASHAAKFKAKYQVTKTTVYTKAGGGDQCSVQETTDSTLIACYNSRGKPTSLQPCTCPNGDD